MKKYLNPEYKMEAAMSNDVITLSHNNHEEVIDPATGNVLYVVDTYRDTETNTYSGVIGADISAVLGM